MCSLDDGEGQGLGARSGPGILKLMVVKLYPPLFVCHLFAREKTQS